MRLQNLLAKYLESEFVRVVKLALRLLSFSYLTHTF